jgi:two-component system OmpR family sensor kinase
MNTDIPESHSQTPQDDIPEDFFRELDIQFLIHELKDPTGIVITVFRSLLEKQEKYGPLTSRQENALKRGLKAILQTRETLNDLLEIGRSEAGQFENSSFRPRAVIYTCLLDALELMDGELFEQVQEHQEAQEVFQILVNAGIHVNIAPELEGLEIVQDETKFRQIVGNLIKNALRFRKTRLDIRCYQIADMLYVEVEDDGPGITPEEHDLIFQQYTQAKGGKMSERKGHGLGLAGALIQARRLGGNVVVQSETDKGALFQFTVPIKNLS